MKKLLSILTCLLWASTAMAQLASEPSSSHIWERAAFGDKPGIAYVRLEGTNGAITTTYEALWAESAAYTPQVAALSAPYCASSDANDTVAGTGARTVEVKGVTTDFVRFAETISTNGQTSVVLATANILLIDSLEVLTAGSGNLNAGIIQCGTGANTAGDPAVTHAYMPISSVTVTNTTLNRSLMFFYGIPSDRTLLCRNFVVGSLGGTAASTTQFVIDYYTNLGIGKRVVIANNENGGGNPATAETIIKFPASTLLIGRAVSAANTGPVHMSADCLSISNTWEATSQGVF